MIDYESLFTKKASAPALMVRPLPSINGHDRHQPYALAALQSEAQTMAAAANGTRNAILNLSAYNLGQLVGTGHLDRPMVETALRDAAQLTGLPLWEIERTLKSGLDSGIRDGRPETRVGSTFGAVIEVGAFPGDAAVGVEIDIARSWQPVDLEPVLAGDWSPPQPSVGQRADGRGLFYASKTHAVISETEAGKTWFALSAVIDEMHAGHHVLYIDFEDDQGGIVGRLLTLSVDHQIIRDHFHYLRPETPLAGIHLDDLRGQLEEYLPTLAVIDGITEAMTLHGLDPLDNVDAARFGHLLPRKLSITGAAVVNLDHVVKDKEGRGRYALGAVHKLNGLDGAAYVLESRNAFGVGITGRSTVKIAKDRPGQLRTNALPSDGGLHWYGDLVLDSHDQDFAEVYVAAPHQEVDQRPIMLMIRVAEALADSGPLAQRVICDTVKGGTMAIRQALSFLIKDGYVSPKSPHSLIKRYPE